MPLLLQEKLLVELLLLLEWHEPLLEARLNPDPEDVRLRKDVTDSNVAFLRRLDVLFSFRDFWRLSLTWSKDLECCRRMYRPWRIIDEELLMLLILLELLMVPLPILLLWRLVREEALDIDILFLGSGLVSLLLSQLLLDDVPEDPMLPWLWLFFNDVLDILFSAVLLLLRDSLLLLLLLDTNEG